MAKRDKAQKGARKGGKGPGGSADGRHGKRGGRRRGDRGSGPRSGASDKRETRGERGRRGAGRPVAGAGRPADRGAAGRSARRRVLKMRRPSWRPAALQVLTIVAAVAAVYSFSLGNDFVFDDRYVILQNEVVNNPDNIAKAFEVQFYTGLNYYRPITLLTFALEYRLWETNPFGYHLTNLILLLGISVVLYLLLTRFTGGRRWPACLIALCFALHPAVSSVGMALGARGDLLCILFLLGAYLAFIHRSAATYAAALALFALALLSKETAVTFPIVLLLMDLLAVATTGRLSWERGAGASGELASTAAETTRTLSPGRIVLRHLPFWAILAGYIVLRWVVLPGLAAEIAFDPVTTLRSYFYLLQTSLLPRVNLVYEPMFQDWFSWGRLALTVALAAAAVVLSLKLERSRRRVTAFWAAWAAVTFLPTANIVGQETIFDERYTVLPLIGIAAGVGLAVYYIGRTVASRGRLKLVFSLVLIGLFSAITVGRGKTWSDDVSFFTQWQKASPANPRPRHHLGLVFWDRGRTDLAERLFSEALSLDPEYVPSLNMLGLSNYTQGDLDAAIAYLEKALALDPNFAAAQFNLASAYMAKGRPEDALPHYKAAAEHDPKWFDAVLGVAQSSRELGRWEEAVVYYRRALRLDPEAAGAYFGLSKAYEDMGQPSQALGLLRQGLKYAPDDTAATRRLGRLLSDVSRRRAGTR